MKRMLLWMIGLYQSTSSIRQPRCRYIPTCSQYAVEAIESHGAGRGSWLALRRVGRCNPFGSFGFDPVPTGHDAGHDAGHDRATAGTETPDAACDHGRSHEVTTK